ncbi:Epidermal growth factor-like domain and ShKT domain and Calycin-like domain-containing protein [Strongyloides ratti]|uniref:Epidermal growth factor-like domain and ShKT domain and Calycin-like domain-containing protein n=1 Tax=Strongyloides ratti TaxID=34506 RepID=A0A090L469_STRRB|nr:Epidermal growth factor-like domain and ShKT domain and Calycin-like domain-containing protein [Strongyloides ratti]CEF62244.1 Epidermal growth factor-like domain and ShKT domain and Calycin-like domain-containing protein [Strongyloides ratti]
MLQIIFILFYIIILSTNIYGKESLSVTKDIINYCDPSIPNTCGNKGRCIKKSSGNRCSCPDGWMGVRCQRPCQDIYKSCTKWLEERRCVWARPISPFFADNCPLTCGSCRNTEGKALPLPLPPILEDVSWIIGKWETINDIRNNFNDNRFPRNMPGGYKEILDIMVTEVPSFDRPGLNVSVTGQSTKIGAKNIINKELGFITIKPFLEDTGFAEFNKPKSGPDLVALELSSNSGTLTIEEGIMKKSFDKASNANINMIILELKHINDYLYEESEIKDSKRLFKHISKISPSGEITEILIETASIEKRNGQIVRWKKTYKKIFDYLSNY